MTRLSGRARRFAARTRQLVVELGVFELRQIQRQRFFEDHDVDALPELRAQQRLRERDSALGHGRERHQQRLESDVRSHVGECHGAGPPMAGRRRG